MNTVSTTYILDILKDRPAAMHKGQAGRVLVMAGSRGMAGACVLALRGALYSGAGLVKAAVPSEIRDIIQISIPEVMCIDRDTEGSSRLQSMLPGKNTEVLPDIDYSVFDAVAVGPGIGVNENNYKIIENLLLTYKGPVVLDADAITCLCDYAKAPAADPSYPSDLPNVPEEVTSIIPDLIRRRGGVTVMTPHPGEADRLLKALGEYRYRELGREKTAATLAKRTGAIILLKGQGTLIAKEEDDDVTMFLNPTGNPGMATGGSGDVLTGMTASLLAQGRAGAKANYDEATDEFMCADPLQATVCAAFLHGLAGDIAAENIGEYGMTSSDIADAISMAIKELIDPEEEHDHHHHDEDD